VLGRRAWQGHNLGTGSWWRRYESSLAQEHRNWCHSTRSISPCLHHILPVFFCCTIAWSVLCLSTELIDMSPIRSESRQSDQPDGYIRTPSPELPIKNNEALHTHSYLPSSFLAHSALSVILVRCLARAVSTYTLSLNASCAARDWTERQSSAPPLALMQGSWQKASENREGL
jgi:hypothetical protein